MRRAISGILIVTILTTVFAPAAAAQEFSVPPNEQDPADKAALVLDPAASSLFACDARGRQDAKQHSTLGSTVGGFFGGALFGFIGAFVAVNTQSESDPTAAEMLALRDLGEDCRYVYVDSYREEIQSRKRSAALTGGVMGMLVFVAVIVVVASPDGWD